MKSKKKRMLVLSAPMGFGHIKAAESLCQAAKEKFGMEAFHVDFLSYLNPAFGKLAGKGWYLMVKYTPLMCKAIYENTDKPHKNFKKVGNVLKIDIKKYRDLIKKYRPDFVISTHPLGAAVTSWMYDRLPVKNGVVITDYVSHSMWVYPNNDRIFVACQKMILELKKNGFSEEKTMVSGIPVKTDFLKKFNIGKIRSSLGLNKKIPVLLIMSGGDAVGPFWEILKSLSTVKKDFQVVVIAGKNKEMKNFLEKKFERLGLKGKVLGFVENIEEYMASADLLVSKAGGMTTTESLNLGLPMLIVRPTPGQEDGNTNFLVKGGAGVYIKEIKKIGKVVNNLLNHPGKIKKMRSCAKKMAKPLAAENILREMLKVSK